MTYLSNAALPRLASRGVAVPRYDRASMQTGIVHFGPGAFHRVHQAWYIDHALAQDSRWGICEVALQTPGVRDSLAPQDGLYSLAILDEVQSVSVIGSIAELLVARESPATVVSRLVNPATKLLTATVTEKGYCLRGDGSLDVSHPDISHDFANPTKPHSLIGFIAAGLRERHAQNLAPLTIISCDNLADNGQRLRRGVIEFCEGSDRQLAAWVANEVAFPSSMVDSITPATSDALRELVEKELGVRDRWPVQREAFTQWVIEEDLRGAQPDWSSVGVTVTDNVRGFERAKLRLLNGAHSTLAYLGSLAGYETVAEAMHDSTLAGFVTDLMLRDISPTLQAPRGLDVPSYIAAVLRRFRNPAIRHLLSQIAWDGSQKLPFRLLGTIEDRLAQGASVERLAVPIAAWMQFVRRKALRSERVTDPLGERLLSIGSNTGGVRADVHAFFQLDQMFPRSLVANDRIVQAVERAYERLMTVTSAESLNSVLQST